MKNEIEKKLKVLIGLPLWDIGRAGNIYWFIFGDNKRLVKMRNGQNKIISDYSLHVQCDWRICKKNKIVIARRDLNYPAGEDPYKDINDFDYDGAAGNRLQEHIQSFLEDYADNSLIVSSVFGNEKGDLNISFNDNVDLDLFIEDTVSEEYWRFFIPYNKKKHFVVTQNGVEYD